MCIRCTANWVKGKMEESYIENRDEIIIHLFEYINGNITEGGFGEDDITVYDNKEFDGLYTKNFEKLIEIKDMIESGKDEDDIMMALEILEVSMDFLQREYRDEDDRKMSGKRVIH